MSLPDTYRKSGEGAIASYSYTDIAEGTGISRFYAANIAVSGAATYVLTTNQIYSDTWYATGNLGVYSNPFDQNFDVTFILPKVIKGTMMVNIPVQISSTIANNGNVYCIITVQKVSKGVATTLATATTNNYTGALSAATDGMMLAAPVVIPKTQFKSGDTFRMNVKLYQALIGGGSGTWHLGFDPKGRSLTNVFSDADLTSTFSVFIPFQLDL